MEMELTNKQIEILIDSEIINIIEQIYQSDTNMEYLFEAFIRDGINDFYSSEHIDGMMKHLEKLDTKYNDIAITGTKLFWKSLPEFTEDNFMNIEKYAEGLELFDDAIKEIENRKKAFARECRESLND
tara:strand:- start:13 stop:396 length:384 start_codon:yes stop_codon:yes gene_type:complete